MNTLKQWTAAISCVCLLLSFNAIAVPGNVSAEVMQKAHSATLLFTENRGQVADADGNTRPDILFTAHSGNTYIYLTSSGIYYQFIKVDYPEGYETDPKKMPDPKRQQELEKQVKTELYRFSVTLAGANPHPMIRKEQKNKCVENFYLPQCPKGITGVATWQRLVYENVYPNIDWVVYSNGKGMKYDFVVRPGGDISKIKLEIKDAQGVSITEDGELLMQTSLGEVREDAPVSFTGKKKIPTHFMENKDGTIGFAVEKVPAGDTLIIDPAIVWSTYFGSVNNDHMYACATDGLGNAIIAGDTYGGEGAGLASAGAYQVLYGGGSGDGIIAKFSADGNRLWSTYYGGTGQDDLYGCATDAAGNIFVSGYTSSTSGVAIGGYQTIYDGAVGDALLAKFSSAGILQWSTYYGNASTGYVFGLSCVTDGTNVFMAGYLNNIQTGLATPGAFHTAPGTTPFGESGFLVAFSNSGSRLWATYYGGTSTTHFNGVTCDGSGNVIATGYTSSDTGIATSGTYQPAYAGGDDAFLVKFSNSGVRLWGTYLGASGDDYGNGCATDASGNIYLTGHTTSSSSIASAGAVQGAFGGGLSDAFIAKFTPSGSGIWSTYYGGPDWDEGTACTVDNAGNVIVAGQTASVSGIASGGFQSAIGGGYYDAMIIKLSASGAMHWASYMGGLGNDHGYGVARKGSSIYMCGVTSSPSSIASLSGAYQPIWGGSDDGFVTKINDSDIIMGTITGGSFCAGTTISVPYTVMGTFVVGNVFTAQLSDASGSFASPVNIGTLISTTSGTIIATIPSSSIAGSGYRIRVISDTPPDTSLNNSAALTIDVAPPVVAPISGIDNVCMGATTSLSDATTGGVWSSTATAHGTVNTSGVVSGIAAGTTTISYTATNSCGSAAASVDVTVNPLANPGLVTGTMTVCPTSSISLSDATGDAGGTWSSTVLAHGTVNTSGIVTGIAAGTTTISYTVTNSCSTAAATAVVTVEPAPNAGSITGTAIVCVGAATSLSDAAGDPGGVWSSTVPAYGTVNASGIVTGIASGTTIISYTVTNSCGTAAATKIVSVNPLPVAGGITGTMAICQGGNTTLADAAPGGVWSSTATGTATIGATGLVNGLAAGTTTISYTVTNSCGTAAATAVFTVNPLPDAGSITGPSVVCAGSNITLADAAPGGVWSSVVPAQGTVDALGIVTGIAAGTTTISYTVTNGCGTAAATKIVSVNPLPFAGSITGTMAICQGGNTTLADAAPGGVWSSTVTGVATVSPAGLVFGFGAGTTTISYTVTNSCGVAVATTVFTVNPLPVAGSITGAPAVCAGSNITLADAAPGGVWSSTITANGTVSATGVVAGIAVGTTTISYTVTNGCGTAAAVKTIAINPLPVAGSISGTSVVCQGSATLLTDGAPGGIWSSTLPGIATVSSTGLVTGLAGGTATVSYTVTNSCGTAAATNVVTVNALPFAFSTTGGGSYCAGGAGVPVGLSNSASGISYQLYNGATAEGLPLTGIGTPLSFGIFTASGTYSVLATDITTGCSNNMLGTAVASIAAIVMPSVTISNTVIHDSACTGIPVTFAALTVNGGTAPLYSWKVNGVAVGSTAGAYTYMPANGDIVRVKLTSNAACLAVDTAIAYDTLAVLASHMPSVSIAAFTNPICAGTVVTMAATPAYGGDDPAFLWTENGINVATGPHYLYTPSDGDVLYCMLISNYFCRLRDSVYSIDTITMTVISPIIPVVSITAFPGTTVLAGHTDTLKANVAGGLSCTYQWQVNGVSIPGATSAKYAAVFSNHDSVSCIVTNNDACHGSTSKSAIIHVVTGLEDAISNGEEINIIPNPNNGSFSLQGHILEFSGGAVTIEVVNALGQSVYKRDAVLSGSQIYEAIFLDKELAGGLYFLNLYSADWRKILHFIKF